MTGPARGRGPGAERPRRVLVCEDSPTQAEHLRLLLESDGYEVEVAGNGSEGLRRVSERAPDLIVSDLMMPGMDGYDFCAAIKSSEATQRIPFVLLTSRGSPSHIIRGLERGADNFITKPFEDDYLLERVRRILERAQPRPGTRMELEVALRLGGREVVLNADKQQILELLFATSEELATANDRLEGARREIEEHAAALEAKVRQRTEQLAEAESRHRARADQQAAVARLGQRALAGTPLGELLDETVRLAAATLDAELAKVLELSPSGDLLLLRAGVGWSPGLVGSAIVPGGRSSQAGYTLLRGEPVVVEDLAVEPRFSGPALLTDHGVVSGISVPIRWHERDFGVLGVHSRRRRSFGEDDVHFVEALAHVVASSIARERSQALLRDSRERLQLVLDSAAEAIHGLGSDGRCSFANAACARMLGYDSPEELIGRDIHALAHHTRADGTPYPAEQCRIREALDAGRGVHVDDEVMWRADGTSFAAEYWAHPMLREGRLVGAVVSVLDVSERRDLERQLRQSQKMEAIGRLAGGVAHDFNNLLGVILGYTQLVRADPGLSGAQRERLDQVLRATERAAGVTRQLLAFSRRQVLAPRVLDLNEVVTGMAEMLRHLIGEDVRLHSRLAPGLDRVRLDPGQVEQVIMNLAVNARDAMPNGGTLTLETAVVELDERAANDLGDSRPGRHVRLAVRDTGVGMDAATQARIFEPFFTTKADKGTGLGLSTVYGIVKQSGGLIAVSSEPGAGTAFEVYFPALAGAGEASEPAPERPAPQRGGSETVLLVEDERSLRDLAREILASAGYRVLASVDAVEALATARAHEGNLDLLLTDVVMPGMSGGQLASALRRERPGIRVVYMSGYTAEALGDRGVLDADTVLIDKPFTPEALLAAVRRVLDQPG